MSEPDLHALERRLAAVEARLHGAEQGSPPTPALAESPPRAPRMLGDLDRAEPGDDGGAFWALTGLKQRYGAPGAVSFTGAVRTEAGPVEYQWDRSAEHLMSTDWAERAERLAALGHPLRLAILRDLLDGERTVAQLVDDLQLASTGVAYHHLNQMHSAGWVTTPRRGVWTVPTSRIIPLMTIISATEDA